MVEEDEGLRRAHYRVLSDEVGSEEAPMRASQHGHPVCVHSATAHHLVQRGLVAVVVVVVVTVVVVSIVVVLSVVMILVEVNMREW